MPAKEVTMQPGTAVRLMIRYELARRDGHHVDGRDGRLVDLIEAAMNGQPQLILGFDCDGDGLPDNPDPEAALQAVSRGTCDCRVVGTVPGEARAVKTEPARVTPAPEPAKKPKVGGRG